MSPYDVIVIGGGQAGLAVGHFLAREARSFVILEAADGPAAAWRGRGKGGRGGDGVHERSLENRFVG